MLINKSGAEFLYNGITYRVGDVIIGSDQSEYAGLIGSILEIRDGDDKETENDTPDIYCSFEPPALPADIAKVEAVFSDLYDTQKTLDDICFDMVIMAPEMITVPGQSKKSIKLYILRCESRRLLCPLCELGGAERHCGGCYRHHLRAGYQHQPGTDGGHHGKLRQKAGIRPSENPPGCDFCGQRTDQQLGEGCGQVHAAGGHPDREE